MRKCEYCRSKAFIVLNGSTAEMSGVELAINSDGMLRARAFDLDGTMQGQDIVTARFCPMCGRNFLRKE